MIKPVIGIVAAIIAAIVKALVPEIDEQATIALIASIAYAIAEGFEGERVLQSIQQLIKSRKFILLIVGFLPLLIPNIPITVEAVADVLQWVIGLILGGSMLLFGVQGKSIMKG